MYKGLPDFAFMNSFHQVVAKKKQGYIPLLRDAKKKRTGIIVVRHDSPIQTIEQLKGQRVAFPAPNAFATSFYTRALQVKQHISSVRFLPILALLK